MVERLGSFAWKLYSASWMLPLKPYMNIAVVSLPLLGLFWFTVTMEKKKEMKIKMKQMLIAADWFLHLFLRDSIEVWFYCVDLKHEAGSRKQLAISILLTARQLH